MALFLRSTSRLASRLNARALSAASLDFNVGPFTLHKLSNGPSTQLNISNDEAKTLLTQMITIRRMETAANEEYRKKNIRGFLHLYSGQEAVAVGIRSELTNNDSVMTAYRCHGWAYLLGVTPLGVIAELFGRQAGCSMGKGGSMHMYAPKFYGGSGIVGGQVPVGAGLGFAHKYKDDKSISVTLYGDGAANQGQVYETFNMAKLWNLPVVFVCENNKFAMGTSQARASASTDFYSRGDYVPGVRVNGMNVFEVKSAMKFARDYALKNGPIILEMETYRYYGHSMSDPDTTYRTKDEIQAVREKNDPISNTVHQLVDAGAITEEEVKAIEKKAREEMRLVVEQAAASPYPADKELYTHIFQNEKVSNLRGCDYWTRYTEQ